MVEVEMAHRDDVDGRGVEAGRPERGHDPGTLHLAHVARLVVDPLTDTGLDQHPARGRLDEQAVERLEEPVLVVDLVGHEPIPEQPRHRAEQGTRVGAERAGLDERGAYAAAQVARPVDRVVQPRLYFSGGAADFADRPFSKSRWNADAVGSDCPWYFDPSSGEPYGRSTGELILKNEIWPIFIPK